MEGLGVEGVPKGACRGLKLQIEGEKTRDGGWGGAHACIECQQLLLFGVIGDV
jgi:hypothetical protein